MGEGDGSTSLLQNFALMFGHEETWLLQPVTSAWDHSAAKAPKLRQDPVAASLSQPSASPT